MASGTMFGKKDASKIILVDTQGHGDAADRDSNHNIQMNKVLEDLNETTAYIMILDGKVPDSEESIARLRMYNRTYFNYWDKVIFVVNKWSYDTSAIAVRAKSNITEESFERELYEMIQSVFNQLVKPKVFYIDCFADLEYDFPKEKFNEGKRGLILEIERMREIGDTKIFIDLEEQHVYQNRYKLELDNIKLDRTNKNT